MGRSTQRPPIHRRHPSRSCSVARLAAWVGCAVALWIHPAGAEPAAYEETIAEAVREYRLGHWSEAVVLFEAAHRLNPNARTLRGMGIAAFEARRYADSIRWLTESLDHPVRPLTPEMRSQAESVLQKAERFAGSFVRAVKPEDADLTVDGREPVIVDGRLKLDPGPHRLAIAAEGYRTVSRKITVRAGSHGTLRVRLKPKTPASPTPGDDSAPLQAAAPEPQAMRPDAAPQARPTQLIPWALVGGGGVLTVTGGILGALALRDISRVENAEGTGREIQAAQERVPRRSGWGFGLAAAGLATAGVGAAWLTFGWTAEPGADRVAVRVDPGGVTVRGAF